jgi:tRNA A37 threonylcarbamoyladenosine synthetase subunit TsaC/SUA5/YrdC
MDEIRGRLGHDIEVLLDAGSCGLEMTTVVDLTSDVPVVIRRGKGSIGQFTVPA